MKVEIRAAVTDDVKDIQRLNHLLCAGENRNFDATIDENFPFTKTGKSYFMEHVTGADSCALVSAVGGKIVGYLVGAVVEASKYRKITRLADLENMFVEEDYRNAGVGKNLVSKFVEWCKSKRVERIRVAASAKNFAAIEFYRSSGFKDYDTTLEMEL